MIFHKKRKRDHISSRYWLMLVLFLCAATMLGSVTYNINGGPLFTIASTIFTPMQNGINSIGKHLVYVTNERRTKEELIAENEELRNQIDDLTTQLNSIVLDVYELDSLRSLYEIDAYYSDYEKMGANVIGTNATNWFSTFTINKGSQDGIEIDMNVLSGAGLVGIVTEVGPHSATVRSIIDDNSNVSAMVLSTADRMIVSGSLSQMSASKEITFSQLKDEANVASVGSAVVTSYISDKYLPGLLIGYISEVTPDANGLTKSGKIIPATDFDHISEVLVVLEKKATGE